MKLYSIACTDSVETAFQEMQVQEPRGLTCINAGSAGAPLWSSRSRLQGLALFGKGASNAQISDPSRFDRDSRREL